MERDLLGFVAGFVIATITSPVGVSGAVFLLPVQLSVFNVPNPQVTPTNLLYNVLSGPGALFRYARRGQLRGPLARSLVIGSAPGVVIGAVLRVYVADDPTVFKLLAAAVLAPTGLFILRSTRRGPIRPAKAPLSPRSVTLAALGVGVAGGIYGIGGGSILGPILVGSGMAVTVVAPAALASTFVTSIVGVATFAVLQLNVTGSIAPDWSLGVACGLGGLCGGYLGASLQPRMPETLLRTLLGLLALGLAVVYVVQAVT
ncbi:sulfite exporter TauE/SafE family protein [Nocardioides sp. URHA0020]|uniref:sulfite exporter TauE/SafE family protein n=1 Tax=Nocardioides sp. URHA0020 TaxID=1380392 RepID=UPI0018CC3CCC|nr:sulfite exporter TauE/SafE family protein [Nocardioides sp. URHA0020]